MQPVFVTYEPPVLRVHVGKPATMHALRHTFGKHTPDADEHLVTVAALVDHARMDATPIYAQPSEPDLEGRRA